MIRYLLDENVDPVLRRELLKRVPDMDIWRVGELGAVPLSTPDPEILRWCEEHQAMLVTITASRCRSISGTILSREGIFLVSYCWMII
jgi:hypothetical protein